MDSMLENLERQKNKLQELKAKAEELKTQRIINETNLKNLQENEQEIIDKCISLGYEPNKLRDIILDKMKGIDIIIDKLNKIMPDSNGNTNYNVDEILKDVSKNNSEQDEYNLEDIQI